LVGGTKSSARSDLILSMAFYASMARADSLKHELPACRNLLQAALLFSICLLLIEQGVLSVEDTDPAVC